MLRALVFAAALGMPLPLAAQAPAEAVETLTDPGAIADAASKAAEALGAQAKDAMLVKQILGRQVTGPGGDVLGTVGNLVLVPGGRVVAVILEPKDGKPIALPYQALKVSTAAAAADKLGLSLPMSLEEARGMKALQDLTAAVLGTGG